MLSLRNKSKRGIGASLGGKTLPIGLDVGSGTIRAVQLVRAPGDSFGGGGLYRVCAAAKAKRSADQEAAAGGPAPLDSRVTGELRRILNQGGFKGRNLVMGLDPPDLVATTINMPLNDQSLDDPQIRSALSFELSRHIGYEAEEAEIRAWRLPGGGAMAPTVMGVAARRELVVNRYETAASAGYSCRRVDCGACALVRCCAVFCQPPQDSIWGVLDIGLSATQLVVAAQDIPVLLRDLPTSGAILSYRVAERLKLSPQAAERLKIDYGIVGGYPGSADAVQPEAAPPTADGASQCTAVEGDAPAAKLEAGDLQVPRLIFSAVRRSLAALAVEVEKSMAYAMHLYGDLPVSTLYLAGGGSGLKGLAGFLAQEIGIEVTTADPLSALGTERMVVREEPGGAWARAAGLALLG